MPMVKMGRYHEIGAYGRLPLLCSASKLPCLQQNTTKGIMTGQELKEIRLNLNMTQEEFGKLLGYAPDSATVRVSELENERIRITATIDRLARYIEKWGVLRQL